MPLIRKYKVSERARSPNQFLSVYRRFGSKLPKEWMMKRENFIKRHLAQYNLNATIRRRLALIVWGFDPEK
jgi:hypothetical protein